MKLTDIQKLEESAAKRGAITVQAADLLAWREEMADHEALNANCEQYHSEVERLRQVKLWGRRVYKLLGGLGYLSAEDTLDVVQIRRDAPADVRGE